MKKGVIILSCIIVVLVILIVAGGIILNKNIISKSDALKIAYNYAGVEESDVTLKYISTDYDSFEYEMEFYDEYYEYELDVSFLTGSINNYEKDVINEKVVASDSNTTETENTTVTEDEAKNIALNLANKDENEVTFTKLTIAKDDGVTVYKVYFYDNEKEYEVYINVDTKEVVKYTEDYLVSEENSTSTYIGIDKAKEIALNHVNLTDNNVTWHEAKLDIEHGKAIYEIEFYYNNYKYEYEINATTGAIISYEKDRH